MFGLDSLLPGPSLSSTRSGPSLSSTRSGPSLFSILSGSSNDSKLPGKFKRCTCPCHSLFSVVIHCVPCCLNGYVIETKNENDDNPSETKKEAEKECQKQKENDRKNAEAERLNEQGLKYYAAGNFTKAMNYFQRAYDECVSGYFRKVEFKKNYERARIEQEKILLNQADELNRQGWVAMNQSDFEQAEKLFDQAFTICPQQDRERRAQFKANKEKASHDFFTQGKEMWEKAWKAEAEEEDHVKAKRLFLVALEIFKKCGVSAKAMAQVVQLKIDGNINFNEGHELRGQGDQLTDKKRMDNAMDKYEQARTKLEEASACFEQGIKKGDNRFEECKKIVDDYIVGLQGVMELVQNQNLVLALNSLTVDTRRVNDDGQEDEFSFDTRIHSQSIVVPNFVVEGS